jgi:hypothetical protein
MSYDYLGGKFKERIAKKTERLDGLKALKAEWELTCEPDDPYLKELESKIHAAQRQLEHMIGVT